MLIWFFVTLFVPVLIGVPIAFSLVFSGVSLMELIDLFSTQIVSVRLLTGVNSFTLLAIPFFVLAGEAMNKGGISEAIVDAVLAFFGHVRGALGYVSIVASMIFAGLSGSAIADTAALGGVLIPMMLKDGYGKSRSTGLVVCAAIIANIIPPSIGFILYGVITGASISKLFIGGLIPGIIIGVALLITWYFVARHDKLPVHAEKMPIKQASGTIVKAIPALILPIFIVVGLRGGIFTPTEAGSVAAAYAIIVGMFVYKRIKLSDLKGLFLNATKQTAKVMMIVACALVVSWVITASNVSRDIVSGFGFLVDHPVLLVLVCQLIFLVFGMVMELSPILMIMMPVLMPLINAAGVDPVYFGIISIINLTFGMITPPVGNVLYVGMGISGTGVGETMKGAAPFMIVEIALILLFTFVPALIQVPLSFLY